MHQPHCHFTPVHTILPTYAHLAILKIYVNTARMGFKVTPRQECAFQQQQCFLCIQTGMRWLHQPHQTIAATLESPFGLCYIFLTIWYASLKLVPRFRNPSIAGPEFRDKRKCGRPKRKCGRPKCKRRRYVSEAALHFGNLCVYELSAHRTKPSASWKNFPVLEGSLLVCGRDTTQTHFGKAFQIAASILKTHTVTDRTRETFA